MMLFSDLIYDRVHPRHVVRAIRDKDPTLEYETCRQIGMGIIEDLLYTGLVKAGDPETWANNFREWPGTTDEIIERIRTAWDALDREVELNDVVSLEANDEAIRMFNHMIPRTPAALLPEPTRLPPHRRKSPGN
jgi:hypothetical protein